VIRFLLDLVEHQIEQLDPNATVLTYLREQLGRTGTKEGCASGDCGACTVVAVELIGEKLQYRAINACITPLANLHGCQLLTVESLKQGNTLHPVQQAMVDCHGSQCGFCTPGIVMSLFAHRKSHVQPQPEELLESLGGNLCRCTGYRPIIAAGVQMYEPEAQDSFNADSDATVATLTAIAQDTSDIFCQDNGRYYHAPTSAKGLADLLERHPKAKMVAGGTDLVLEITQNLRQFESLVYTGHVAELKQLHETPDALHIGAAVSFSDARASLCRYWPDLAELIDRLGSLQIRNQGTLGGNVANASPIGDMPPVLIALQATLVLQSNTGKRELSIENFFLGYRKTALKQGEFIHSIVIPKPATGDWFQAYKISKRLEDDISAVCGAFYLRIEADIVQEVSIAFGGMAEIPKRATQVERVLAGQPWNEASIEVAITALSHDFTPISDFRASAEYRAQVAGNLLRRLLLAHTTPASELRVTHHA
jgi:xanthine dehydrogenase small subunit